MKTIAVGGKFPGLRIEKFNRHLRMWTNISEYFEMLENPYCALGRALSLNAHPLYKELFAAGVDEIWCIHVSEACVMGTVRKPFMIGYSDAACMKTAGMTKEIHEKKNLECVTVATWCY
jgi:hypothetical protein